MLPARAAVPTTYPPSLPALERMVHAVSGASTGHRDYELGGSSVARFNPGGFVVGTVLTRPTEDRQRSRWLDLQPVRLTAVDARGPGLHGPTAIGALAVGATALGALAIGRLAIGRARIKRLEIDELEVRHLRVVDLEVVSERPRQPATAGDRPDAAPEPPASI